MSFIHDAIMESNSLEDEERIQKIKNPPQLKGRKKKKSESCVKEDVKEELDTDTKIDDTVGKDDVTEPITEETKLNEESYVNIEDILPPEAYVESLNTQHLQESVSPEVFEKLNDMKQKRIATYRKATNIDENFEITEEHINKNKWAFDRTCMWEGISPEKLKAELLGYDYTAEERK